MKLIVTIDTEEDGWGHFSPTGHTVRNIERIPEIQGMFDSFEIRPTYLVTYPVLCNVNAVTILKDIMDAGKCEIGMHCHPWNTPPFEEEMTERNSMLCNLSPDLQLRKLTLLHRVIMDTFQIRPVSFRSGRWACSDIVVRQISSLVYRVDSSITAYTDWSEYQGPDYSDISPAPFRFSFGGIFTKSSNGSIVEVPATVGYLQGNYQLCNAITKFLCRKAVRRLRLRGLLDRLRLVNKVVLSPEISESHKMIGLTRRLMRKNYPLINMHFHSTSLEPGLTQFVRDESEQNRLLDLIRQYLSFVRDKGIGSITLSESVRYL